MRLLVECNADEALAQALGITPRFIEHSLGRGRVCRRLEEWLVQSAKSSGLKMTDYGFGSDNGVRLHAEINQRLGNVARLVSSLLEHKSRRLLYLKSLLVEIPSGV